MWMSTSPAGLSDVSNAAERRQRRISQWFVSGIVAVHLAAAGAMATSFLLGHAVEKPRSTVVGALPDVHEAVGRKMIGAAVDLHAAEQARTAAGVARIPGKVAPVGR